MKKIIAIATAAALGLGVAACDSAAENEAEDDIEAMEDNRDAQVNQMENEGMITDDQADQMDDETDMMEENMEDQVDEMPNEGM